jgi:hypothetical protein
MTTTEALNARLAEVRERILGRARATLEEALSLLDAADRNCLSDADRERVYIMIHNLAGTTGSVGMHDVARAAKDLDRMVAPWLRSGDDRPPWKAPFNALAVAMAEEAHRGAA